MATSIATRPLVQVSLFPRVLTLTNPHAPGYQGEYPERDNPHGLLRDPWGGIFRRKDCVVWEELVL